MCVCVSCNTICTHYKGSILFVDKHESRSQCSKSHKLRSFYHRQATSHAPPRWPHSLATHKTKRNRSRSSVSTILRRFSSQNRCKVYPKIFVLGSSCVALGALALLRETNLFAVIFRSCKDLLTNFQCFCVRFDDRRCDTGFCRDL